MVVSRPPLPSTDVSSECLLCVRRSGPDVFESSRSQGFRKVGETKDFKSPRPVSFVFVRPEVRGRDSREDSEVDTVDGGGEGSRPEPDRSPKTS